MRGGGAGDSEPEKPPGLGGGGENIAKGYGSQAGAGTIAGGGGWAGKWVSASTGRDQLPGIRRFADGFKFDDDIVSRRVALDRQAEPGTT